MIALILAALLGLVRLIWAPDVDVLLFVDWALFVAGIVALMKGGSHGDPAV